MFALRFTNIPDAGTREYATEAEAIAAGRKAGFEFNVTPRGYAEYSRKEDKRERDLERRAIAGRWLSK